ncbi:type VII secretion protein EccCa [Nocardia altamirensis]|uniref:type VII secretion protein EccCa n=1 Tax=Nocardia altamirensis TaxID=472158 RepID=UPI0008403269|nr:type VII secretion protein EccCa [Nocardia altamirensis]
MATKRFSRPATSVPAPVQRIRQVVVEAPVELPKAVPTPKWRILMPVVVIVGMAGMMLFMFRSGGFNPMMVLFPLLMLGGLGPMLAGNVSGGKRTGELNEDRKEFLQGLGRSRGVLHDCARSQYDAAAHHNPAPAQLVRFVGTDRMWERTPGGKHAETWGEARIARGRTALDAAPAAPESAPVSGGHVDPLTAVMVAKFIRTHSTLAGMPIRASFTGQPALGFRAEEGVAAEQLRGLVRALLCQIAVFYGPDHVLIAAVVDAEHAAHWEWLKWLPHTQHPDARDGLGAARMVYRSTAALREGLAAELTARPQFSTASDVRADRRQIVIVCEGVDDEDRTISGIDGVTWLQMDAGSRSLAARRDMIYLLGPAGALAHLKEPLGTAPIHIGEADYVSPAAAEVIARRLSSYRLADTGTTLAALTTEDNHDWASLMGIIDPAALDVEALWATKPERDRLRIVYGHDRATDRPIALDIKDGSVIPGGMGPHGMCIGATGSGKSEWLRTLILSLATQNSPDVVTMLLIDFKGGATFLGLERLPHVTAIVTDMAEEADLLSRFADVLEGELERRQRLLRETGGFKDISDYERARARGMSAEPLPTLLCVIDEFTELLTQHPEFAKLFVRVGRLGRALGVHFLFASQTVEQGSMRGLEAHLSYRIALRLNYQQESKVVIGDPAANFIALDEPGHGFLRAGAGELQEFQTAYVSGEFEPPPARAPHATAAQRARIEGYAPAALFTADPLEAAPQEPGPEQSAGLDTPETESAEATEAEPARTLMQVVVDQLARHGRPARRLWLPELRIAPTLDQLLAAAPASMPVASLRFPVALLDRPRDQRQDVWSFVPTGAAGNIAIMGGPQSGKSTLLQTLVLSAAMTHTPEQVQFYILDFGGGRLAAGVAELPHVGSVARRGDTTLIRRTLATIKQILEHRERRFAMLGISDMAEVRTRIGTDADFAARIKQQDTEFGDIFFIVDGWDWAAGENNPLYEAKPDFEALAASGLSYGIHLVISAASQSSFRPAMFNQLQSRIELRLGSPTESVLDRSVALSVPVGRPGRGIGPEALHLMTALPRLDSVPDPATLPAAMADAVARVVAHYPGRSAEPVKLLPDEIDRASMLARWQAPVASADILDRLRSVPFGVRESDLEAATLNFVDSPHLLIVGSRGSGRSTAVESVVTGIKKVLPTPAQARFLAVDYRYRHMELFDDPDWMLLPPFYGPGENIDATMADLTQSIRTLRTPPVGVTAAQIRERSWWQGPEYFVIIDDLDLVAGRGNDPSNPLRHWAGFGANGLTYGLHLIVVRNVADAAISMHADPVLRSLNSARCDVLLFDGPRTEILFDSVKPQIHVPGECDHLRRMHNLTDLVRIAR